MRDTPDLKGSDDADSEKESNHDSSRLRRTLLRHRVAVRVLYVEATLLTLAFVLSLSDIGRPADAMTLLEVVAGMAIVLGMVVAVASVLGGLLLGAYRGFARLRGGVDAPSF